MKSILVLVADNCLATSVTGPMDMFNIANTLWRRQAGENAEPLFNVQIVSIDGESILASNGMEIKPSAALKDIEACDLLLVAANHFTHKKALRSYIDSMKPGFEILRKLYRDGVLIAGYCSATFVLAASGLLDYKKATTSWFFKDYFNQLFPKVEMVMDKLVVEENHLWTAGATTSYMDLCLKLIDKMGGQQVATMLSKVMLIDNTRNSQQPFMALPKIIEHGDETIAECQEWMQLNLSQSISLDEMSSRSAMSKRNFIRRFKKAVGETPAAYLQSIRVEAAKRYLESSELSLQQILEKIGYDDTSAFRRVFQKMTSLTPKAYREKFA